MQILGEHPFGARLKNNCLELYDLECNSVAVLYMISPDWTFVERGPRVVAVRMREKHLGEVCIDGHIFIIERYSVIGRAWNLLDYAAWRTWSKCLAYLESFSHAKI